MVVSAIRIDAESPFLTMLNRLEGFRKNTAVLYIKVSALSPANKISHKTKALVDNLKNIIASYQANPFILSNQDVVLIGKNVPSSLWDEVIQASRRAFSDDRAIYDSNIDFAHLYHLERDYLAVKQLAQKRESEARQNRKPQTNVAETVPLAPEHLDAILRNIQGFNILKLIRRQEAIQIDSKHGITGLFFEYFTSMVDLKKAIAPDVDVLSNRWLFQYLSETLDKRMLGICDTLFQRTQKKISLNLNISTLFTAEFLDFLEKIPADLKLVVEVQLMDVMLNAKNYKLACGLLREAGHEILIDSLVPISFKFIDINLFDPDYIKLNWPFKGLDKEGEDALKEDLKSVDPSKIILMRVEDEKTLKWGLSNGIMKFQGYFIDSVAGAACRRSCPTKEGCSITQCAACKARVVGSFRAQCRQQDKLDFPFEKSMRG